MADKIFPTDYAAFVPTAGSPAVSADRILLYRQTLNTLVAMDPVAYGETISKASVARIVVGNALNGDTLGCCDYLDAGDGLQLKAAVDAAVASGDPTVVWVREGTYTLTPASKFTVTGLVTVRGVYAERVTLVCPSANGARQTACEIGANCELSDVTVSLVSNPASIVDVGTIGYMAVAMHDNATVRWCRFTYDGSAGAGPVLALVGRYEAGVTNNVRIENCQFDMATPNLVSPIWALTSDASIVSAPMGLRAKNLRARISGVVSGSNFVVSADSPCIIDGIETRGFAGAFTVSMTMTNAVTAFSPVLIENVYENMVGAAYHATNNLELNGTSNATKPMVTVRNLMRDARDPAGGGTIDARVLRVVMSAVDAKSTVIESVSFSGSGSATGNVEVRCASTATMEHTRLSDISTPGAINLLTPNPSVGPWTYTALSGVVCGSMDIGPYMMDTAIGACTIAGALSINSTAESTWVGVSTRFGSISDQGIRTRLGVRSQVSNVAPSVTDDLAAGYLHNDTWIDLTTKLVYVCLDNTNGAAVWAKQEVSTTTQAISGNTTVQPFATLCTVTANADITLPTPRPNRRVVFKKATASALASVNILRAGGENIENVAATYAAATFNSVNYAVLVLISDGTNWWIEHVS